MATVRGRDAQKRYMSGLPKSLTAVLRGAARAGAKVFSDEVKVQTPSSEVRENLRTRSQVTEGRIVVRVDVKPGWARSLANWLEYGTSPHFISVDEAQRGGRSVRRINSSANAPNGNHSLVIGGQFVGTTVLHPGARPHPVFRPVRDTKEAEAIAAAQQYINAHVKRSGIDVSGGEAE
jgi:hypothetical protein